MLNNNYKILLGLAFIFIFVLPITVHASSPKIYTGTVIGIDGSQVIFTATTAAKYIADVGNAKLVDKYGYTMAFDEILIGDKVQVTGNLWGDSSISAANLKDLSLYTHNATFTGKIATIDTWNSNFVLQSKLFGSQTINTDGFTVFKKNGKTSSFSELQIGMSETVKVQYKRSKQDAIAKVADGTARLIDVDLTGTVLMKGTASLTVQANGLIIYGVDISQSTLKNNNNKITTFQQINIGDSVKVTGKHLSGSVQVFASAVKDVSIAK